jgi:hypothetical protein
VGCQQKGNIVIPAQAGIHVLQCWMRIFSRRLAGVGSGAEIESMERAPATMCALHLANDRRACPWPAPKAIARTKPGC